MANEFSRRSVLASCAVVAMSTTAGCSTGCLTGNTGLFAIEEVSGDTSPNNVISIENLAEQERGAFSLADRDGVLHQCMDDDTRDSVVGMNELAESLDKDTYIEYGNTIYGAYLRIRDEVYVSTMPAPETNGNPCC